MIKNFSLSEIITLGYIHKFYSMLIPWSIFILGFSSLFMNLHLIVGKQLFYSFLFKRHFLQLLIILNFGYPFKITLSLKIPESNFFQSTDWLIQVLEAIHIVRLFSDVLSSSISTKEPIQNCSDLNHYL